MLLQSTLLAHQITLTKDLVQQSSLQLHQELLLTLLITLLVFLRQVQASLGKIVQQAVNLFKITKYNQTKVKVFGLILQLEL